MQNKLEKTFEALQTTKCSLRDEVEKMCSVCDDFEREYRSLDGIMKIHNGDLESFITHFKSVNSKMSEVADELSYHFDEKLSAMDKLMMNVTTFQLELEIAGAQAENKNNKTSE